MEKVSVIPVLYVEKLHQISGLDRGVRTLDEGSVKILEHMHKNPNSSLKEVAETLGFHRNTISRRWNNMWRDGVLLKKSVCLHPEVYKALGFGLTAAVFIDVPTGERREAVEKLTAMDFVHELFSLAHRHDLMAVIRCEDVGACYSGIRDFYKTRCIKNTETLVILSFKEREMFPLTIH